MVNWTNNQTTTILPTDIAPEGTVWEFQTLATDPWTTTSPVSTGEGFVADEPVSEEQAALDVSQAQAQAIQEQAKEWTLATEAITAGIQEQLQTKEELEGEAEARITEDRKLAEAAAKREAEFAIEQADILKEADVRQTELEQEAVWRAEERAVRDTELLRQEASWVRSRQEEEIALAEQARALQITKDNNSIKKAERDIEVAQQKANWAFNKLWLTFSSTAIGQTQQIATQGANKLAELKIQASFNQAKISVEIAKLNEEINKTQLGYTTEINKTIDKFQDISLELQSKAAERIKEVSSNLLLTNKEKNDAIAKITSDLKNDIRGTEDDFRIEQERLTNDVINKAEDLETNHEEFLEKRKVELDQQIVDGSIFQKTPDEISQLEQELGLIPGSVNSMIVTKMETSLRDMYSAIIWPDFNISNIEQLKTETANRMQQGQTLVEALSAAVSEDLKTNERFLQLEKARSLEIKAAEADIARTQQLATGGGTTTDFSKRLKVGDITEAEFGSEIGTWFVEWDTEGNANKAASNLFSRGIKWDQAIGLMSRFFGIQQWDAWLSDGELYIDWDKLRQVDSPWFDETVFDFSK